MNRLTLKHLLLKIIMLHKFHIIFFANSFPYNIPSFVKGLFIVIIIFQVLKCPWSFEPIFPQFFKLLPSHYSSIKRKKTCQWNIFTSNDWGLTIGKFYSTKCSHLMAIYTLMFINMRLHNSTYPMTSWA